MRMTPSWIQSAKSISSGFTPCIVFKINFVTKCSLNLSLCKIKLTEGLSNNPKSGFQNFLGQNYYYAIFETFLKGYLNASRNFVFLQKFIAQWPIEIFQRNFEFFKKSGNFLDFADSSWKFSYELNFWSNPKFLVQLPF